MSKPCPISSVSVAGRAWPSRDIHALIPATCDYAPYMAGKDFADGENVLDFLNALNVTTRILMRERQDHQRQREEP